MEKTKWIVAILFALLLSYLMVQAGVDIIIGDDGGYRYIQWIIGMVLLEIAVFVAIGMVEEREKKPRQLSLFFFLHLLQMIVIVLFMFNTVWKGFETKYDIISFVIQVLLFIWYGRTLQTVLQHNQYPRSLWVIETGIFYVSVMSFMVFSQTYVLESIFSIEKEVVVFGLFFYQIIAWMVVQRFPKIATFMHGIVITGMLLLSPIILLWEFSMNGY